VRFCDNRINRLEYIDYRKDCARNITIGYCASCEFCDNNRIKRLGKTRLSQKIVCKIMRLSDVQTVKILRHNRIKRLGKIITTKDCTR
jgi:hypothetical protein